MEQYVLNTNKIIENVDEVVRRIQNQSGHDDVDFDTVKEFIINQSGTEFFLDNKMQGKTEDDKEALYLWLDTGYVNSKGNAIFISLIKQDGYDIEYKGSWVGDYQFLAN